MEPAQDRAHAYRDGTGVHSGQTFCTMGYDAAGKRVTKAINGTGVDDCTYHYFLSGNSVVEERNGSDQPIKDHVWVLTYVDEAVQTRVNTNLSTPSWSSYYHLQDANFNDLGVVNASGNLVERYEYAAYGQRQVFTSAGANDPGCYTPILASKKVVISSVSQPWGLNEIGHQGLLHDEQTGLVYNRARMLQPTLGRFMQTDPLRYVRGMNTFLYGSASPIMRVDPQGLKDFPVKNGKFSADPMTIAGRIHLIQVTFTPDPKNCLKCNSIRMVQLYKGGAAEIPAVDTSKCLTT